MMLTVYDLQAYMDRLGDLTRDADPLEIVVEATELVDHDLPRRFAMQWRAAAAADAHYLRGVVMADIATATGRTPQTVRNLLDEHGPRHYLTLGYDRAAPETPGLVAGLLPLGGTDKQNRRRIRERRDEGWRIVPATMNLVDRHLPEGGIAPPERWPMPINQLWEHLGS